MQEGALEDVISLAELAPTRVAEALGRNRLILDHFHDHDSHDKILELTWDSLSPELRRKYFKRMLKKVMSMARKVSIKGRRRDGNAEVKPYRFNSDDLDLDRTFDKILTEPLVVNGSVYAQNYSSFMVNERNRRPCAYAVIIDESRSMQGSKALTAALASAVLLLNIFPEDSYTVIGFSEHARTIRALGKQKIQENVIKDLLDVRPDGCTDLAVGLEAAHLALSADSKSRHVGILISDGWINTGHDPLPVVSKFDRLHVIELPGGDPALCNDMAKAGNGLRIKVHDLSEVPSAIQACLTA